MLEGFTQEELDKFAAECRTKYEKKEYDLMVYAAGGGMDSYDELLRELKKIDFYYADEAEDYMPCAFPLTDITSDSARKARDNGTPVRDFAYRWLQSQQFFAEPNPLAQLGL